ncbi:hypothetical protein AB1K91_07095 [Terribacillus sp. 179-K 1B1 HS]|uniref:hypothetical protein n=1 Tax=Terribacillus sp. 179-K 1B1 HS TaxID=3142388 RepID=UPI0039A01F0D
MIFTINLPNGTKHTMHSKASDSNAELVSQVEEFILKKFDAYITNFINSKGTRKMLQDCANYLLRETREGGVLTTDKLKTINKRETVISNLANQSVYDHLYGNSEFGEDSNSYSYEIESIEQDLMDFKEEISNELSPSLPSSMKHTQQNIKWKETKTYKLNLLYSTRSKHTEVGDDKVITYNLEQNDEWITESPIFDGSTINFRKVVIHQSRNGRIPLYADYVSNWSYVDTENRFEFNGRCFYVDKACKQYRVFNDNVSEMDHVLCFYLKEKDEYFFYDENIEDITFFINYKIK